MANPETKRSIDNPVPDDAVWKHDSDRQFFEASKESGDKIEYHIRDDGLYYLGAFDEDEEDIDDEELNNGG